MNHKFKKIYIEITNICNLSCTFCSKSQRPKKEMTTREVEHILKEIDDYTDYIYLHVKGEPLLHSQLEFILDLCDKYNKQVNITTNGTLIDKKLPTLLNHKCVRQINFSLHSENNYPDYLEKVFTATEELAKNKYVVYRFWTMNNNKLNKQSTKIVEKIIDYFNLSTEFVEKIQNTQNIKISNNIYINKQNQFIWPDEENDYYEEKGYCHALTTNIGILSDGTVVPCCLDGEGKIPLGNIFETSFESIITSEKFKTILTGFRNRKVTENLCKHCSFKSKF